MARHGENIRKRKDGRWEGRYPVYSEEKHKKIYRSVYARTYEEVKEKVIACKSGKGMGKPQPARKTKGALLSCKAPLFTDAAAEWLDEVKKTKKLSTYVKYRLVFQNHLESLFQDIEAAEITDLLAREKISDHLSDSIRKSIYCVLNQILKYVSKQYSIVIPPLNRPASDIKNKPVEILSKREQAKLLAVLNQKQGLFSIAVSLCLYTGLRLGEVCALKWSDIDFENHLLTVSRTVQRLYMEGCRTKTVLMETEPKSICSRREIPLTDTMLNKLISIQDRKEYIFGGHKPLEPRTLQNHFKRILGEAGLSNRNFHILRHTFATNCVDGGTDVKSLSELLGHSDVQITLNRYVHPSMEMKRKHLDVLSLFYGQIYGQAC